MPASLPLQFPANVFYGSVRESLHQPSRQQPGRIANKQASKPGMQAGRQQVSQAAGCPPHIHIDGIVNYWHSALMTGALSVGPQASTALTVRRFLSSPLRSALNSGECVDGFAAVVLHLLLLSQERPAKNSVIPGTRRIFCVALSYLL